MLSWHQTAAWRSMPHDVVGYTFNAATYCPGCIIDTLPTGKGEVFDGWAYASGADPVGTEDNLDEIVAVFGIDRQDEQSYDSDTFPKVVFRDHLDDDERCDSCGETLDV